MVKSWQLTCLVACLLQWGFLRGVVFLWQPDDCSAQSLLWPFEGSPWLVKSLPSITAMVAMYTDINIYIYIYGHPHPGPTFPLF